METSSSAISPRSSTQSMIASTVCQCSSSISRRRIVFAICVLFCVISPFVVWTLVQWNVTIVTSLLISVVTGFFTFLVTSVMSIIYMVWCGVCLCLSLSCVLSIFASMCLARLCLAHLGLVH
jgi:membrane-associated HD superfamily phosphohydrolase